MTGLDSAPIAPRALFMLVCIGACLLASSCAMQADAGDMVPPSLSVAHRHPGTVAVDVRGGSDTGALDKSRISNAAFAEALEKSIEKAHLFSGIVPPDRADYLIFVMLVRLDQPVAGINIAVKMQSGWTLRRRGYDVVVWKELIETRSTGVGFRAATEGAARAAIEDALQKISELNLSGVQ